MSTEEPSYLAFARANVRDAQPSSPAVVRELVARIDRNAAKPNPEAAVQAIEQIREAVDLLFKGQSTPTEAVRQIVKHLSSYEVQP
ncbi:hypothetical protein [Arthrobacter sp. YN]|uniref:hypothetical protein n=1 Tax=Arthrobacter sp. YN TaxID=2020486 RepID=UPI000B61D3C8|nr:hypothetical protein [Arthrobacter sp. YN]ASN20681.1 hypothetical protein CGK93_14080 [Arthrobacter sp. YN]